LRQLAGLTSIADLARLIEMPVNGKQTPQVPTKGASRRELRKRAPPTLQDHLDSALLAMTQPADVLLHIFRKKLFGLGIELSAAVIALLE
jgi:hypothetical protein